MAAPIHFILRGSRVQNNTMITVEVRQTFLFILLIVSTAASSSVQSESEQRSLVQTGNTIDEAYAKNSDGHTLTTALFGCVAAMGILAGLLFLVDREVSTHNMWPIILTYILCVVFYWRTHETLGTLHVWHKSVIQQQVLLREQVCIP